MTPITITAIGLSIFFGILGLPLLMAGVMSFDSPNPSLDMKTLGYTGMYFIPYAVLIAVIAAILQNWWVFTFHLIPFILIGGVFGFAFLKTKLNF